MSQLEEGSPTRNKYAPISQNLLLQLIGEIDSINLRSVGSRIVVSINIGGENFEVITDCCERIDHTITRSGIREILSGNGC